jgi:signal transduction histidine kinase
VTHPRWTWTFPLEKPGDRRRTPHPQLPPAAWRGIAQFAVSDTGCGIAERNLDRIFDEFYQVARPEGGPVEGSGLGLPVARRLAQLLHGRIDVDSAIGRGSAFTLRLPASDPASEKDDVSANAED